MSLAQRSPFVTCENKQSCCLLHLEYIFPFFQRIIIVYLYWSDNYDEKIELIIE